MLHKTRAIAILYVRYSETSIIAKIYTERFGLQSYMVNGVRTHKTKNSLSLFQPLTLLDMVVYHKNTNIQRISEVVVAQSLSHIPFDVQKSAIALVIAEILSKTLHEEEHSPIFPFLYESILYLDYTEHYDNFTLHFIVHLIDRIGLLPDEPDEIFRQLYEYKIVRELPHYFQEEQTIIKTLQGSDYAISLQAPSRVRQNTLDYLLLFCRLHLEYFGEIKSLAVLREVLR